MAKLPEPPPPDHLAEVAPALRVLPAGTELWRVYFRAGTHPSTWRQFRHVGPVKTGRFDHHLGPGSRERGILYTAQQGLTCLAEVFQESRVINTERGAPWLVGFALLAPVTLLDLTGTWPTRAGASMVLSSGSRARAQRWSQAIYLAYPHIRGLWYPSSMHANRPVAALYERTLPAMPPNPFFHRPLSDPALGALLAEAARELGFGLYKPR